MTRTGTAARRLHGEGTRVRCTAALRSLVALATLLWVQPLLRKSAVELAALVRRREVSAREVVDAHIARIEQVNARLNAVVAERFADARREADAADARLRAGGDVPPLLGVPCTVKEAIACAGMPHTSGLVARRGVRAAADAPAVRWLREAGAIVVGVTNVSELCMWMESNNRVYGRTCNPYDPSRTCGGSSGGEGAIVGAGGVPFGLGADIGGSIRIPAFFNGVFGHKPTGGRVPVTGHYPMADPRARRFLTLGPLARRAEDIPLLMHLLARRHASYPEGLAAPLGDVDRVDVSRLVVYDSAVGATADLLAAKQRAVAALAALGCEVRALDDPAFHRGFEVWSALLGEATDVAFAEHLGGGGPAVRPARELLRWAVGRSPHTLPAIGLALIEPLPRLARRRASRAAALGRALRARLDRLLGDRGVLVFPSFPRPAPRHNEPLLHVVDAGYTGLFNVLELPSTQVPCGLDRHGVPLGVQVVGGHGRDHVTIAVAMALERALGGWVPPLDR
ncbi:MAG: amidase [Deltaproteobacteria bacterium]|nr:MAG: amidase [Deltaproteobacteria bacterium]